MSQFSRRARWLNTLFPASKIPQTQDPAQVSDDVSLVQPYDGSGWGLSIGEWSNNTPPGAPAATAGGVIVDVALDAVFRLMGAHACFLAGQQPDYIGLGVTSPTLNTTYISWMDFNAAPAAGGNECRAFPQALGGGVVIGPGCKLRFDYIGGSGTTVMSFGAYGCLAPLGTSFNA